MENELYPNIGLIGGGTDTGGGGLYPNIGFHSVIEVEMSLNFDGEVEF